MKPATRRILINKDGTINKRYVNAFKACDWDEEYRRVFPVRYNGENRNPSSLVDLRLYIRAVLKRERLAFTQGICKDRAPRGGTVGTYYKLTPLGWQTLTKIRDWNI